MVIRYVCHNSYLRNGVALNVVRLTNSLVRVTIIVLPVEIRVKAVREFKDFPKVVAGETIVAIGVSKDISYVSFVTTRDEWYADYINAVACLKSMIIDMNKDSIGNFDSQLARMYCMSDEIICECVNNLLK